MRVNFNFEAAATQTGIVGNQREMGKSLLRLSTGLRILNAADDSAGLFIADQLMVVGSGLEEGNRNIQTGLSALRIAESSAGQIFNRLNEIYKRAVRAANDVNDPNARNSLQQEIRNFVDAIQKIGTDTEYNGIKLLDGTFTNKNIHYGSRMDQTLRVDVSDIRSQSLGAQIVSSVGRVETAQGARISSTAFNNNIVYTSNQTLSVASRNINATMQNGSRYIIDAGYVAEQINSQLRDVGFEARAVNISVADRYSGIANVGGTADLTFYVGDKSFTISGVETNITLDRLVERINREAGTAGADLSASISDGRLVLTSSKGYTIGLDVQLSDPSGGQINMNQLIQGGQAIGGAFPTQYGSVIKVGTLHIARDSDFSISANSANVLNAFGTKTIGTQSSTTVSSQFKNLYSIDVTTNESTRLEVRTRTVTLGGPTGGTNAYANNQTYNNLLNVGGGAFFITSSELSNITVAGQQLSSSGLQVGATDAAAFAQAINNNTTLRNMGIRATANNTMTATDIFSTISVTSTNDLTINIYLGQQYGSPTISLSAYQAGGSDGNLTLNELVTAINNAAGGTGLVASSTGTGSLVLTTANGETIGIELINNTGNAVNLAMFSQAASGTTVGSGTTGSAIKVGQLQITAPDVFNFDFTGATSSSEGLGIATASGTAGVDAGTLNETITNINIYGGQAEMSLLITSKAIQRVDSIRAQIGAIMNNLQSIYDSQKVALDNTREAENVIRNTDYAEEMMNFTRQQIKMQASMAMLAQANQMPQLVLQLLR